MPESQFWRGVVYGNGMFVAVSNSNPASSPDGINWTVYNTVDLEGSSNGVVTFGNGLFVAPSMGDWTRLVTTSPDGVNWTAHPNALPPSWPPGGVVQDIIYGGGQYVAVGEGGAIATSPDGVNWTARTSGVTTDFAEVAYGNGLYVAVGEWFAFPTHPVAVSPDGINWTAVPAASVFNETWSRIAFGGGRFVARSFLGETKFMYSTDGVNWTLSTIDEVSWSNGQPIVYAEGRFVAVGGDGSGGFKVYASDDGSAWSVLVPSVPYGDAAIEMGMAYGNGVFVTVEDGTNVMRATCVE